MGRVVSHHRCRGSPSVMTMSTSNKVPSVSPFGLIQEQLWPNEWLILVVSMLLNCTSRKQVEKILPEFIRRWREPRVFLTASIDEVAELCRPLGFANRRTANIFSMTRTYVDGSWVHASELPGIGQYGARSWEIFCRGTIGDEQPKDHALVKYWEWVMYHWNK